VAAAAAAVTVAPMARVRFCRFMQPFYHRLRTRPQRTRVRLSHFSVRVKVIARLREPREQPLLTISALNFAQCAIPQCFRGFSAVFQFNRKIASAPERSFSTESADQRRSRRNLQASIDAHGLSPSTSTDFLPPEIRATPSDCFYEHFRLTLRLSARIVADAVFPAEYARVVMPDLAAPHRLSIVESAEEQRRTELTLRCCQSFAADFPRSRTPVDFR
jgi:hypothetical protein